MGRYSKYQRFAAPLSAEQLQEKLDKITEEGLEIIHYEEKKQETNRFYVTMILGAVIDTSKTAQLLND